MGVDLPSVLGELEDIGYLAVFLVMLLDGANVPFTPVELFLGLTGYLAAIEELRFFPALVVTILGNITGHCIAYFVGFFFGKPFFTRYGRYVLITPEHLARAEALTKKLGPGSALLLRFIPGLRSVTSLLLGTVKMPFVDFILLSLLGVTMWNLVFMLLGFFFGLTFAASAAWLVPLVIFAIAGGFSLAAVLWYRLSVSKKRK